MRQYKMIKAIPVQAADTTTHTFLVVSTAVVVVAAIVFYLATRDWKGCTCPEEVDLGTFRRNMNNGTRKKAIEYQDPPYYS